MAARYARSAWNHWFTPAPMMIEHFPFVRSAVPAHSRAKRITSSRPSPV